MHKMKTLLLFLLLTTISLSLSQPSPNLVRDTDGNLPNPVRDIDGNLVRAGTDYYILPVFRGRGGGVRLGATRNKSCPLDVVQARSEVDRGLPVTFTPVDPKKGVIRESTDLNIIFSSVSSISCIQSNVWMVEEYDGQLIVSAHGVAGNPGEETISNWFKIGKYENASENDWYRLVFCPIVCDLCLPACADIGVKIAENGIRRLTLSDEPFVVMFKKA